jgi:hypothetical protein
MNASKKYKKPKRESATFVFVFFLAKGMVDARDQTRCATPTILKGGSFGLLSDVDAYDCAVVQSMALL